MRRFFYPIPNILSINQTVELSEDNYQHWCKVLRAKVGDVGVLFDGTGGEYTVVLTEITKKTAFAYVQAFNPINRTNAYHTTLLQAISGSDKMDYTIQKACEMGVNVIVPIVSARSERFKYEREHKKHAHWQKIAQSSCEQCGLNIIPTIMPPRAFADALMAYTHVPCKLLLDFAPVLPRDILPITPPTQLAILVGAEGGFDDDEIQSAKAMGFLGLNLGERILRTETAGVAAMAFLAGFYAGA